MKKGIGIAAGCVSLLLFSACSHLSPSAMRAEYTDAEPPADLSGAAWRNAPEYRFTPYSAGPWYQEIERVSGMRGRVLEGGAVRLLWNEKYLYVGVRMEDSDIVDEAVRDQTHIFTQADAVELFLKHEAYPCYWEIYGSAGGRKCFLGRLCVLFCESIYPYGPANQNGARTASISPSCGRDPEDPSAQREHNSESDQRRSPRQ